MAIVFVNLYERAGQLSSDSSKKTAGDREPLLSHSIEDAGQHRSQKCETTRFGGRKERIYPLNALFADVIHRGKFIPVKVIFLFQPFGPL
jgi:hypothetical protein